MNTIEIVFSIYGMIAIVFVLVLLIKIDADNKKWNRVEQPSVPKMPEVKPMKKNQNRTNELKPCPFCGSERLFYAQSFLGIYMVKCLECGAIVNFNGKEERAECIKAWNRREAE